MAKGECNCGGVQFEIDEELAGVIICHCSICRRSTGSNGIAVVVVPNEHFRWLSGQDQITMWTKPNTQWETWFCKVCGSRVPGNNDPKRMFIPAGTITQGGEALRVTHHIWVQSKAIWDVIGDAGKQHVEKFGG
ncbi:MAG: GFA family protein [Pseudomarimonas sp.]